MKTNLALIGYGEAAATFANAARWRERSCAYDVQQTRVAAAADAGITGCKTAAKALSHCKLALCLVTADQALFAAQTNAAALPQGAIWCDMNSVAPQSKVAAAQAIETGLGHYVDAAILAPVYPRRLGVPIFLSGPRASQCEALLQDAGFSNVRTVGAKIGEASAIKMIRSVMVKGVEALSDEMMAAATAAGVIEEVLSSLDESETRAAWADRVAYNRERMETHGLRRAAEMEEAVKTLQGFGVDPILTRGTVIRQRMAGERLEAPDTAGIK